MDGVSDEALTSETSNVPTPRPSVKCKNKECKGPIKRNQTPVVCEVCTGSYHSKCSGLARSVYEKIHENPTANTWTCQQCVRKREAISERERRISFSEEVDESSGKMNSTEKKCLRVIQWNAVGFGPKIFELQARLLEDDIDVCLIQQAKLGGDTPSITGYKTIRADRLTTVSGGGLIAFVRWSLPMEELGDVAIDATETSTFRIRLDNGKWIHLTNLYVPPEHSKGHDVIRLSTEIIPALKSSLICGDFNGHTALWDDIQPTNDRGELMVDWIIDNNLHIVNNGEPTRLNRETGNWSTLDVTLCGSDWCGKVEWSVGEPIGSSDHLPIMITVNSSVQHQSVYGKRARWRNNGVDWAEFRNAVEEEMDGLEEIELTKRIERFNGIMIEAANTHVGKVKPGKKTKV